MVYVLDLLLVEYSAFVKCPSLNPLKIDGRVCKHARVQNMAPYISYTNTCMVLGLSVCMLPIILCQSYVLICYPYVSLHDWSRMLPVYTHNYVICVYSYVTCMCLYVLNYVTSMSLNIKIKLVWCFFTFQTL